jgi:hypothetical protein
MRGFYAREAKYDQEGPETQLDVDADTHRREIRAIIC